jgi:hypothetical protein
MGFSSGLVSQFGWGVESTAGTPVTVNKFQPHISESINLEVNRTQGEGLYGSTNGVALLSRHVTTTRSVSGDFEIELTDKGLGTLYRAMLGSTTTPTVITGSAYQALFTPGDLESAGSSLTVQVGRPRTNGTVTPFTWNGCKISSWEISSNVTDPVTATFSIDGRDETTATALASASYSSTQSQFTGAQLTVELGGTVGASGTGGFDTTGASALAGVKGVTVRGDNPMNTERFYANGGGVKAEQIVNGYRTYEVELDMDFVDPALLYALKSSNATTAIKLTWALPDAITGSHFPSVEILLPFCKVTEASANVDGTDLTPQTVTLQSFFNGVREPIQIRTKSTDTAL